MADPNVFVSPTGPGAHAAQHVPTGADPLPLVLAPPITLTDAATITTDATLGLHFRVTLGGNRTLANPTGLVDGQRILFEIVQDGTGNRTLSYGSMFNFGTDVPSPTLSTVAGQRDFLSAIYNSTTTKLYVVGFARGFA
jgi:hypothetical protein